MIFSFNFRFLPIYYSITGSNVDFDYFNVKYRVGIGLKTGSKENTWVLWLDENKCGTHILNAEGKMGISLYWRALVVVFPPTLYCRFLQRQKKGLLMSSFPGPLSPKYLIPYTDGDVNH